MRSFSIVLITLISTFIAISYSFAETIESLQLVSISPEDQRAVVKLPDNTTKIIKLGDPIGTNGKVVEIVSGRVVVEEKSASGPETVIIRLVPKG
jgi:Tfp pilus assembly protein PilP